MQRFAALTVTVLLMVTGCSSPGGDGEEAATTSSTDSPADTSTSVVQMSIPESTAPATSGGDTEATGSGQVIMLKLHVGDIDDAEDFYHSVFGATVAYELGDGIRVLTMPEGPGFILIEEGADGDSDSYTGSFLIQVPDLETAEAAAIDLGATHQQAFEGNPGGEEARSVDLLDPWGNQIEILQLG